MSGIRFFENWWKVEFLRDIDSVTHNLLFVFERTQEESYGMQRWWEELASCWPIIQAKKDTPWSIDFELFGSIEIVPDLIFVVLQVSVLWAYLYQFSFVFDVCFHFRDAYK